MNKIQFYLQKILHQTYIRVILQFYLENQVLGKTKFVQGVLEYFGLENEISSPTFTIVNEYHKNDTNIYHFDVYRLADVDEFYAMGGDEYFSNGICLIEWGEMIESILPKHYTKITFKKNDKNVDYRELIIDKK